MTRAASTLHILLALLLTTSLFPGLASAASDPATDAQETALRTALAGSNGPSGPGQLQAPFQPRNELQTLYLVADGDDLILTHSRQLSSETDEFGNPVVPNVKLAGSLPIGLGLPPSQVAPGPVTFAFGTTAADVEISAISLALFLQATSGATVTAEFLVDGVNRQAVTIPIPGLVVSPGPSPVGNAERYAASAVLSTPLSIPANSTVSLRVSAVSADEMLAPVNDVYLAYGHTEADSQISLIGDFARVAAWSENAVRVARSAFPTPSVSSSSDRTLRVVVAEVNAFGDGAMGDGTLQVISGDGSVVHYDSVGVPGSVNAPNGQRFGPFGTVADAVTQDGASLYAFGMTYPETLPAGVYTARYTAGESWSIDVPLSIGGGGAGLHLANGEVALKTVLIGERTTFRLELTNENTATDTFALNSVVGALKPGWSASVAPAQVTLAPRASADITLQVVPAPSGANNDLNTVDVSATSLNTGATASLAAPVSVKLTSSRTEGVGIIPLTETVSLGPGATRTVPVVIQNNGNAADQFILTLQGAPAGWTVRIDPAIVELDAQSQAAPLLRIEAPADAATDTQFPLTLRASRVDNLAIQDTQVFTIQVFPRDAFAFLALGQASGQPTLVTASTFDEPIVHALRDEGPDASGTGASKWDGDVDADKDFDQSTRFRLVLRNEGDREDNITLTPQLLTTTTGFSSNLLGSSAAARRTLYGYQDLDGCEEASDTSNAAGDGLNDGWRARLFDAASPPTADSLLSLPKQSYNALATDQDLVVRLAAGETRVVFVEMGWSATLDPATESCIAAANRVQGDPAATNNGGARNADPAPGHALLVEAVSQRDPSHRATHVLNARITPLYTGDAVPVRVASQRYQEQALGVHVDVATGEEAGKRVTLDGTRSTTYLVRATNLANEMDTLRFTIPQNQSDWEYGLEGVDRAASSTNTAGKPGGGTCTAASVQGGQVVLECTVGSFDEIALRVRATAPADAAIGLKDTVRLTVASKDSFALANDLLDTLDLTTTVTGAFAVNLLPNAFANPVAIYPGGSALVPFTLQNLGTNDDNFGLDLPTAPASSTGWSSAFSLANPVFVPAGKQVSGYLLVRAPDSVTPTSPQQTFQMRATSQGSPSTTPPVDLLEARLSVVARSTTLSVAGAPPDYVATAGEAFTLTVQAQRLNGTAASLTYTLDTSTLPDKWQVTQALPAGSQAFNSTGGNTVTFNVRPDAQALGSTRAALRVVAKDANNSEAFTYLGVSLSSPNIGIDLAAPGGDVVLVAPGAATKVPLTLSNLGAGVQRVTLTAQVPTGWAAAYDVSSLTLQPLQTIDLNVTVTSPADLASNESRVVRLNAATLDGLRTDQLDLTFTTGSSDPVLTPKLNGTSRLLPEEAFAFAMTVTNTGNLTDELLLGHAMSGAFADVVAIAFEPASVALDPGQSQDVAVTVTLPANLAPGTTVPVALEARSRGPFLTAVGTLTVPVVVIDHKVRDVDGDLVNEYAVDRNLDATDGYEQFRDVSASGTLAAAVDAVQLLSNEARAKHTVLVTGADGITTSVLSFLFDGDGDGKADLLVDRTGDGIQDIYWDADRGYSHALPTAKDVTKDGRADDFIDLDGVNGLAFDVYYDAFNGVFGKLLQVDLDNNGQLDYVVDSDGNGVADPDETVLFGGPDGTFVKIQERRDVDGDGKLDTVVDSDGDGNPDYFVPAGSEAGVAIVLEDVNGDGILDWTYDADGDGRRDSYFDPATGETGLIDAKSNFVDQLKEYWYIGALFGVVLVLFVVLLLVTRK